MKTLVVYDTQFGNTEKIARIIAEGMTRCGPVQVLPVAEAADVELGDVDLLIVGGPTQGHRARKPLRDWVDHLRSEELQRLAIAAFDTRISWPMFLSGSAAHTIANLLQRHNARLALPPESFIVEESEGPISQEELDRAASWAETLAAKVEATGRMHTGVSR